jgi:hypothetical protein
MRPLKRVLAATEILLIAPAVLFMSALVVRSLQPQQLEPAHTAQRIVDWYAVRPQLGLWVLLTALPLTVFLSGGLTLFRSWREPNFRAAVRQIADASRAHLATLLIALATLSSAAILVVVAVHVLAD